MSSPLSIDLYYELIVLAETLHHKVMVMSSSHLTNSPFEIDHTFPMGHDFDEESILPIDSFQVSNSFQSSYHDPIESWLEESFKERFPLQYAFPIAIC